jgi:hypothetical protein
MRIRIAILPLLALGTTAAPCAAQGGGNDVPRELVQALLAPVAMRGQPEPAIAVGRLPGAIPAGLVPPEATVLGGVGGHAIFTVAQAPAEAIAGWRAHLQRAGWRTGDPALQALPNVLGFCGPDRTFLVGWAAPRPQGGSELQVRVVGAADSPYSPCSGERIPTRDDVPFPALLPIEGAQMMGSGSSADYRYAQGRLRSTRSPGEIAAELVAQLRQAGWRASDPRVGAGGATAWGELRDASGKSWRAVVAVLPVAEGEASFVVRVVGASVEQRYPVVDWVPVAHAAGPPVPGELVRALLVGHIGGGDEQRPTLVSGSLPRELAGTPLPPGARAVGGLVSDDEVEGVAFVPGGPPLTLSAYAQVLRRAGWHPRRLWVLVSRDATDDTSEFCDANGRMVSVSIVPVRDGGSYLKLRSHGPIGFCTPGVAYMQVESPLPLLRAPAGAEMRGGSGGYGGSPFEGDTYGRLETALSPAAVVEHYAGVLRQAGWAVAPPAADEATATATGELRDARGNTWHGVIAVSALSPTEHDVMVRVVRPQPQPAVSCPR